mmetsp:Transcript_8718/g.32607  ORF Transcript_8718/g.32607 Transcript_8718/m.32607 type:complete len:340 (-) Transcript_8718:1351-2370(-)
MAVSLASPIAPFSTTPEAPPFSCDHSVAGGCASFSFSRNTFDASFRGNPGNGDKKKHFASIVRVLAKTPSLYPAPMLCLTCGFSRSAASHFFVARPTCWAIGTPCASSHSIKQSSSKALVSAKTQKSSLPGSSPHRYRPCCVPESSRSRVCKNNTARALSTLFTVVDSTFWETSVSSSPALLGDPGAPPFSPALVDPVRSPCASPECAFGSYTPADTNMNTAIPPFATISGIDVSGPTHTAVIHSHMKLRSSVSSALVTSGRFLASTAATPACVAPTAAMISSVPAIHFVEPGNRAQGASFFGLQRSSQLGLLLSSVISASLLENAAPPSPKTINNLAQ